MTRLTELTAENERLRVANRRLQAEPAALERDKLIVALRDEIAALKAECHATHPHAVSPQTIIDAQSCAITELRAEIQDLRALAWATGQALDFARLQFDVAEGQLNRALVDNANYERQFAADRHKCQHGTECDQ